MSFFNKIQNGLEKVLVPISQKIGGNKVVQAIASGMTMFLPITLGGAIFSMLANFPLPAINAWFASVGLTPIFSSIATATINLISVYVVFSVAYRYANDKGKNGVLAGLFSLATFLILMPQTISSGEENVVGFLAKYMGSSGLFVALIVGILISMLYVKLMSIKQLVIKLPDSVPPMVTQSLEPLIIGIIIFVVVCLVKLGLATVTDKNIFDLINNFIAAPIMTLGNSPATFIIIGVLANLLFFLGIHPVSVMSAMTPVLMALLTHAIEEYQTGQSLSQLDALIAYSGANSGGTGCTLSLIVIMLIFAKSKQYRAFSKVTIIPNAMNVNEPVIFGLPVMLNPILFIPFVLVAIVGPVISLIAVKIGFLTSLNPMMLLALPFTTPPFLSHLLIGGWKYLILAIIVFITDALIYYPFLKIMDKQALELEANMDDSSLQQ